LTIGFIYFSLAFSVSIRYNPFLVSKTEDNDKIIFSNMQAFPHQNRREGFFIDIPFTPLKIQKGIIIWNKIKPS